MRKLKYHEQKLLKKADLYHWKAKDNDRETHVLHRYHIQDRDDYMKYNKICGTVTKLANELSLLPVDDSLRKDITVKLLSKLYQLGLTSVQRDLSQCQAMTVASFCRRRLATVLTKLKMAENLKEATTFIEQGHIRVGTELVTDPAYFVTRNMEDYVTWVDSSKIKKKISLYHGKLDDYDLS
jgi:U3 small nucleolar ribonucleoprotein protein IMP3